MSIKKDYEKINIVEELNKKINTLNHTRVNRIHASERLYAYSSRWDFIFFFMNIGAVIGIIFSIVNSESNSEPNNKIELIITSIFSMYTILVQYFTSTLNYNERALKFHYEQLEIEDCVLDFKKELLVFNIPEKSVNESEYETMILNYHKIMAKYQTSLKGVENHSHYDESVYQYNKSNENGKSKPKDFSFDNLFIYFNIAIVVVYLTYLVYLIRLACCGMA